MEVNLDTKKSYYQVKNVNGTQVKTYLGQFVRVYQTDLMALHIEFNDYGILTRIDQNTNRLDSYFIEA
jgi:hypothetical protein